MISDFHAALFHLFAFESFSLFSIVDNNWGVKMLKRYSFSSGVQFIPLFFFGFCAIFECCADIKWNVPNTF